MPARPQRRPHLFLPLGLSSPHLPSPPRILKPALLVLGLRHHLRHDQPIPFSIHGHKREISRRNMAQSLLPHILYHHPHTNLHRSPKRPIHTRLQNQQLPNPHWSYKIQMIHTRRHRERTRMPRSSHRSHQVDILHQPPAKQASQRIRVRRQHNLAPLRLRLGHRPFQNQIAHSYKSKSPQSRVPNANACNTEAVPGSTSKSCVN
jgi:hypothetical protein